MNESVIHISSVKQERIGTNKPHDFNSLKRLSMTYSWYNIRSDYKNNKIKYTHDGSTWQTITFTDGLYSYSDIND